MIDLIVLDVDGCLSDGAIIYDVDGVETKKFNVKDGLAIRSWIDLGHQVAIITGRNSSIVEKRAKELGITLLYQGVKDKKSLLLGICEDLNLGSENIAAIGDDLNDFKMLDFVSKSFTPCDGADYIKQNVKTVLSKKGGSGVVREMIELLLKEQNEYDSFIGLWT